MDIRTMTCRHCCGADQFFDLPMAEKELKTYKRKGSKGPTRKILSLLDQYDVKKKSLLDIGGGIGAIQWYFHQKMGSRTTDVDASEGYLHVAREYAAEKGWDTRSEFVFGDFSEVADQVSQHDFVSLDKVICCYPDYRSLLDDAVGKAGKALLVSFPLGGVISRALAWIASVYFQLCRIPFRPYIHHPQEVLHFVESRGMKRVGIRFSFPWNIWLFERTDTSD